MDLGRANWRIPTFPYKFQEDNVFFPKPGSRWAKTTWIVQLIFGFGLRKNMKKKQTIWPYCKSPHSNSEERSKYLWGKAMTNVDQTVFMALFLAEATYPIFTFRGGTVQMAVLIISQLHFPYSFWIHAGVTERWSFLKGSHLWEIHTSQSSTVINMLNWRADRKPGPNLAFSRLFFVVERLTTHPDWIASFYLDFSTELTATYISISTFHFLLCACAS